jgi:GNAT superfamily N-acetyltransferase
VYANRSRIRETTLAYGLASARAVASSDGRSFEVRERLKLLNPIRFLTKVSEKRDNPPEVHDTSCLRGVGGSLSQSRCADYDLSENDEHWDIESEAKNLVRDDCRSRARSPEISMTDTLRIHRANPEPAVAEALAEVLMDCVEGGASVSFMHPLPRAKALAFWEGVLASAARGERIVLVAEDVDSHTIVGTVQVVLAMPDNQPHRADVAKMLVHRRARRRGLGAALMQAAEAAAREAGKTLLVLDAVTGGDAERLYERLGWQRCGVIPGTRSGRKAGCAARRCSIECWPADSPRSSWTGQLLAPDPSDEFVSWTGQTSVSATHVRMQCTTHTAAFNVNG